MTIHFTISPALLEFTCHFAAAVAYIAIGCFAEMNFQKPSGRYTVAVWVLLIIAIILTVIGSHL